MKFGTRVIVRRGSNDFAHNLRDVPGTLVGARGNEVKVMLDFLDGPFDDVRSTNADWFGKSQVREMIGAEMWPQVTDYWHSGRGYPVVEENIVHDSVTAGLDQETHDRLIREVEKQTKRADDAEEALANLRSLDEIGIVARKTLIAENERLRRKLSTILKTVMETQQ